jgi:hypothetical protein
MAKEEVLKEDDESSQEEYVVTETPPEANAEEAPEAEAAAEDEDSDADARLADADSDEDGDDDDKPKRKSLTPEEKRQQRQQRKFRRRAAIEHKERELAFLRAENEEFKRRLHAVEKRTTEFNQQAADQRLNETSNEIQTVDRIIAKAIEQGQGEDVAKALSIRDQLMERRRQLESLKAQSKVEPKKEGPDPRVAAYAKEWISANDWYDPRGGDEDSVIVQAIDKRLAAEGYNPATEEYWIELDNRVAKRLPHKYGEDTVEEAPKAKKRGGPPVGGKREYAAPSTRKEIYISPERKQALIDAGVWENPELRQKYIKRYADYDRNNSSR